MNQLIDLTGERFGRWKVLGRAEKSTKSGTRWLCRCKCGIEKDISGAALRHGGTKSCGCLSTELAAKRFTTHGGRRTKLYGVWCAMKRRCYNKNVSDYLRYGGRGIKVCVEWLEYEPFMLWAGANGYKEGLTLERLENDGDYSPGNCVWETRAKQARNTRNLKSFYATSPIGRRYRATCHTEFAMEHGLKRRSLSQALQRGEPLHGWTFQYIKKE